jgi:hypothetical protein
MSKTLLAAEVTFPNARVQNKRTSSELEKSKGKNWG